MRRPDKVKLKDGSVRWRLRMRQPPGSPVAHKYVTFATKAEALAASAEHERKLSKGEVSLNADIRFAALVAEWKRSHLGKSTGLRAASVKDYEQGAAKLIAHFGERKLASITVADVEAFREDTVTSVQQVQRARLSAIRAKLTKIAADPRGVRGRRRLEWLDSQTDELTARLERVGPRATNKALGLLRMLFKFAEARRYVTFNPAAHVRMAKAPERVDLPMHQNVLDESEIQALVAATPADYRAAILVLAYGGLRFGELLGLTWGDLELSRDRLLVRQQRENVTGEIRPPKTKSGVRFVKLQPDVVQALREHKLRSERDSPEFVFPFHGRRFRDQVFFPALRRAKLRRIRIHDLRHTAASMMIAAGVDAQDVAHQLGHKDARVTLTVYVHWFEKHEDTDVAAKVAAFRASQRSGCEMVASATERAATAA